MVCSTSCALANIGGCRYKRMVVLDILSVKNIFIRTKVKNFLARLTLKVLNTFYKIIRIWSCTELWAFLVSNGIYQKAMGNDKEGPGGE